ncbi:MAG: hypothetical protein GY745_16940 [Actinomycetia bacterium]|nr:hypothetical protein [Actinomycetes bacterium]MCP4086718.1 hypothetical protein [Actinomycetes bacterium]
MKYERLVIEAGDDNTFTLDLHRRLTVIAGVGRLEREGLVSELVGALGKSRAGVHLEMRDGAGRHLAVFRPHGARHRVVDIDQGLDVSPYYAGPAGDIDLLDQVGLDHRTARRRMRVTAEDLTTSRQSDAMVNQLGHVDQEVLWDLAGRLQTASERLDSEAEATGSAPEDAAVVERIEQRHAEFEEAQHTAERVRKISFAAAALAALAAVPMSMTYGERSSVPFILAAVAATLVSYGYWRRMEKAREAEADALKAAGAISYLGFHLQRVDGLLGDDANRQRLVKAAEEHREAELEWETLVGDVSVEWAGAHRDEIWAAARMKADADGMNAVSSTMPDLTDGAAAELAHALIGKLAEVRNLGIGGESLPLILDDPFVDLDPALKPSLLELLGSSAEGQQIIVLTADEDIASWARLEALTGELTILEPSSDPEMALS